MMDKQHPLVKSIAQALRQRCKVQPGDHLLVGVSGGADSVALLRALCELSPRRGWNLKLTIGHVNHHLRPQADGEAAFVQQLAQTLQWPCVAGDLSAAPAGVNVEHHSRVGRYALLQQWARDTHIRAVLVAHHSDDALETLLMRLARGSSGRGLAGLAWRRKIAAGSPIELWRPMLGVSHADAIDYLTHLGQRWMTDHTNADVTRLRAALRHQVVPALKTLSPTIARKVVATSQHLKQTGQVVEDVMKAFIHQRVLSETPGWSFPRADARKLRGVVLAGVLRQLLVKMGVPADGVGRKHLQPVVVAIRDREGGVRSFPFANHITLTITRERVACMPKRS